MKDKIGVKKRAFTLIEITIVIFIISIIYFISLNFFNSKNSTKNIKSKLEIVSLKEYLIKNNEFTDSIRFSCIKDDELSCFIVIDGDYDNAIKSQNIFLDLPTVYNYDKNFSYAEFEQFKNNNITYDVFFELKIDSDRKHKNYIVEVENSSLYLIKVISNEIIKFSSLQEIRDSQNNLKAKVQDAF